MILTAMGWRRGERALVVWLVAVVSTLGCLMAQAQLLDHLQTLSSRYKSGDPGVSATNSVDGPKSIAVSDLNGDGRPDLALANTDGTVTVLAGNGDGTFRPAVHLPTGADELRGIVCADLNGDGRVDIAVAAPYAGAVYVFEGGAGGVFLTAKSIPTWRGARNVAAGDFSGDGHVDLVVAGTTNGLRQLRHRADGSYAVLTNLTALAGRAGDIEAGFPKPAYVLQTLRLPGAPRDELLVTHAESEVIWVLAADAGGVLEVRGSVTNRAIHSLRSGRILSTNGPPDLVTAHRDMDTVDVLAGEPTPAHFSSVASQIIHVAGAPRAVEIADLDGDGWDDLIVVLRNFDRVVTYKNDHGKLVARGESTVGNSPRELALADFNGDGVADIAVMNRDSADVSVLLTVPGRMGFMGLDLVYPVDGEVVSLAVKDLNGDGRDDVIQLHRGSGEFSVRLAAKGGALGAPSFYPMGTLPSEQVVVDVNGDKILDVVVANLGRPGTQAGSLSTRLGRGDGTFEEVAVSVLPPEIDGGRFFSLVPADFDGDGILDLAVGYFDCRIVFFKGLGGGRFSASGGHEHLFIYEARSMIAGDFDGDGDLDLAGVGYYGGMVVVENRGDFFAGTALATQNYGIRCCGGDAGAVSARLVDVNSDGDPDILVGSQRGTTIYLGKPGMGFELSPEPFAGVSVPANDLVSGDFDGNGTTDLAVSCKALSCVSILTRTALGEYAVARSVDVPSGGLLASGDLDGDGYADLVGTGSVLWTALSSRPARRMGGAETAAVRMRAQHPVINEFLARNTGLPLDEDGGRRSDWVELFNGADEPVSVKGWRLLAVETNSVGVLKTNEYRFPAFGVMASHGRMLLVCVERLRSPYHTGFGLEAAGGAIYLLNAASQVVDRVVYGPQQENVSFGRYQDGNETFASNEFPSPGRANADNGPVEPVVHLVGFDPASLRPGSPIQFLARAVDDVGIVGVQLVYRRMDIDDRIVHRVNFYDDGMHGDAGMQDGLFAGVLEEGLPAGAEIQFYLEATDLSDRSVTVPDEAVFARPGEPLQLYSMAMAAGWTGLELSEVVPINLTGLKDELGGVPDWFEVRNVSATPALLAGVGVSTRFFGNGGRFLFPSDGKLGFAESVVVFCDDHPDQGDYHAPFRIDGAGERLFLTGTTPRGTRTLLDWVEIPKLLPDQAYARAGASGEWVRTFPTPGSGNAPGGFFGSATARDGTFTLLVSTAPNRRYTIEYTDSLVSPVWHSLPPLIGDGLEQSVRQPLIGGRYFRVRTD